ncbi:alpha/beta hydrolase fold domain-containing protein [Streptomyces sp. NPDC060027]|uniref:alpha/beta hydrolase fold domain-containing protein n=1 Tax=Streptomyces sp. NPDC060027 TaxID=3347040 RepID=UPI003681C1B1
MPLPAASAGVVVVDVDKVVPNPRERSDPLVSPAHPSDTGDLNGIAPALLVTAEFDLLKPEGERHAGRLRKAGALVDHVDVPKADYGYDGTDDEPVPGPTPGPRAVRCRTCSRSP